MKKKTIIKIIEVLLIIILIVSGFKLINYTKDTKDNKNIIDDLSKCKN